MTKRLSLALALAVAPALALAQIAPPPAAEAPRPERRKPKNKDRWGWMQLLRDDVNGAMARATLEKKQRNTLEKDLNTLRRAIDDHLAKAKVDQNPVDKALRSIRQEFRSKAFTPAERDDILEDLDHLPVKEKPVKQPRARRNPMPRYPRRPY
jgi:Spy/CpxP family protein refolding chaperone